MFYYYVSKYLITSSTTQQEIRQEALTHMEGHKEFAQIEPIDLFLQTKDQAESFDDAKGLHESYASQRFTQDKAIRVNQDG